MLSDRFVPSLTTEPLATKWNCIRSEVERCIRQWGCGGRAAEVLQQSRAWPADAAHIDQVVLADPGLGVGKEPSEFNTGRTRPSSVRRIK